MKRSMATFGGVAIVALLGLTACGKKTETATTSKVEVDHPSAPAAALTPPSRKPGLWDQKMTTASISQTMKICLDESVEQKMKWWGSQAANGPDCAEQKVTPHIGGGWDFHSVCKMGESGTITSDGQATGDFNSSYKVEIHSVTTGSPMAQANGPHTSTIEATWAGPCPADMKPGDMTMPNGMKINMLRAMDATAGMGHGPGERPTAAEMAKLRAQAMEMAKSAKQP
jgi:hypothetical protein